MTTAETPAKPVAKPAAKTAAKTAAKPAAAKAAAKPADAAPVVVAPVEVAPAPVVVAPVEVAPVPVEVAPVPVVAPPAPVAAPLAAIVPGLDEVGAKARKSYEDARIVAKSALDAVVVSSEVLQQGLQDLGGTVYELAQQSLDESIAASKQMLAAKTLREVMDVQSTLAKSQFDRLLDEAPRLGGRSVKLVEDALAPISASVNAAVDKLVKPIA